MAEELTLAQAATELGLDRNTLMNYVASGKPSRRSPTLPTRLEIRNGRATHIVTRDDFEQWKRERA